MYIINDKVVWYKIRKGSRQSGYMNKKILVIDDDHELGELIDMILQSAEFHIHHAYSGIEGLRKAYEVHPDLIILDIMMPDMDGFTVCARLREMVNTPILMVTALTNEKEMLRGFNAGVDDFLRKPFSSGELRARVQSLLRRAKMQALDATLNSSYKDPVLEIDFPKQVVKLKGKTVDLSPKEFSLLALLVRERGKVVTHHELVREVWGGSYMDTKPLASLYIYYLRKKLQDGKHGHHYIRTFWGRGYWFIPWEEKAET